MIYFPFTWNLLRPSSFEDLYDQTAIFSESFPLSVVMNMNSLLCGYKKSHVISAGIGSAFSTDSPSHSENKHGANS